MERDRVGVNNLYSNIEMSKRDQEFPGEILHFVSRSETPFRMTIERPLT